MINRAFTLIEVLVSVAIVAILSIIVVFVLNPQEMLKQSRDSNRLNDISNVSRALNYIIANEPNSFLGLPNTIYISLPDPSLSGNQTSTCSNMNLPPLPSGYNYYCVSSENLVKNDGTGWIPINFSQQPVFKITKLPIDPKNDINNYYVYIYDPSNNSYEFNANLESNKYNHLLAEDSGDSNFLYEIGSKLTLYPLSGIGQSMALKNESNQVIKSDQNFGIYIAQAASQGQVAFFIAPDQVSGDNYLFWDNTNKRLGIWTSFPGSKLSISGGVAIGSSYATQAAPVDGLIVEGNVGIGTTVPKSLLTLWVNSFDSPALNLISAPSGSNTLRGKISFWQGSEDVEIARIQARSAANNSRGQLSLYTCTYAPCTTNLIERMRITDTGNVGIGTTTPQHQLDIVGNMRIQVNSSGNGLMIAKSDSPNTYYAQLTNIGGWGYLNINNYSGSTYVKISTNGDSYFNGGNIGIGTTTPAYKLDVFGDIRTTGCLVYNGGTLGTCVSEAELKNIISPFQIEGALDKIVKLQPVKYSFKSDPSGQILIGLIAQDTEKIVPELIETTLDGKKQIKYGELQWLQLEAIKELQNKINKLENENQDLKIRLQQLENKLQ